MDQALKDALDEAAITHRILEMEGHGDMTQGHLSLRDPAGRGFWLKRHGIGLGEVIDHHDFILLDLDGHRLAGEGGRHSEWPIHSEIYRRRPEIAAVAHTHPFHAGVFSATRETLRPLTLDGARFSTPVPHHKGVPELINTVALGRDMAATMGDAYAILMGNHGITFVGRSLGQCLLMGLSLERACQAQLAAAASGLQCEWPDADALARRQDSGTGNQRTAPDGFYRQTWDYYARKLGWAERGNPAGMRGYFRL